MIDLTTKYLGMQLRNPLVVSASPLTEQLDNIKLMEDSGAAAVVMHSLFEEQITLETQELDCHLHRGAESFSEAVSYFPDLQHYNLGPEEYLEHIQRAKAAVKIPIIGSLNGVSTATWVKWIDYAQKIEQAGADALELNIYFIPTDPEMTGSHVEEMYCSLVRAVRRSIRIPLAVKLGPYFSSMMYMAGRLKQAGADALVLFNRFYQPDFDLENLRVLPKLNYSTSQELLLRLHWAAILSPKLQLDLALTGGVHTALDVLKAMMAGARVAMMTSGLLRHGISRLALVLNDLTGWMVEHDYESIRQMQGSMNHASVAEPAAFERANYLRVLSSYSLGAGTEGSGRAGLSA
jgi:dihydroorotate dehydrogenase (fumarate)